MKNIAQRTLQYNIQLVKYENTQHNKIFDLTTIHSLLIDQNPKFIELRQLIINYNSNQSKGLVNRPHLQHSFILKLYTMLSELTRIPIKQNQCKFLNKIHSWAFQLPNEDTEQNLDDNIQNIIRPSTGSTRTRTHSAIYSKRSRPDSAIQLKQNKKQFKQQIIQQSIKNQFPNVDFKIFYHGEQQFFLKHRTIHQQQQIPRIRLKQYQRKVFYDQPDQDNQKFKLFNQEKKPTTIKINKIIQIPLEQSVPADGEIKTQELIPSVPGAVVEGVPVVGGQVPGQQSAVPVEIDVGIEQPPVEEQPEPQVEEVIDKLRPRTKVYKQSLKPITRQNKLDYQRGICKQNEQRQKAIRLGQEQEVMTQAMRMWASTKNKVRIQQRRRAQSVRIMTKKIGSPFQKYTKKIEIDYAGQNVVDFSHPFPMQTKSTNLSKTGYKIQQNRAFNQAINNALTTGKLSTHVNVVKQESDAIIRKSITQRVSAYGDKTKKRAFQQILKQAQSKVYEETREQIQQIKQSLTTNKISLGANKIYRSLSHQVQKNNQQFIVGITGQEMYKNPFFKVAKKKKKKKKKKK